MFRRSFFASLLALAALVAMLSALPPGSLRVATPLAAGGEKLNVILLTVESTRADLVRSDTAPHLLSAAREGLSFRQHRSSSGWTAPNIVTLLTGLDAYSQGINAAGDTLPPGESRPLAALGAAGWRVSGLQAFMLIDQFQHLGLVVESGAPLQPWLAARVLQSKPFFLWYHYLETHLPYAPSTEFMPDWKKLLPSGDAEAEQRIRAVLTQPAIPAGSVAFQPSDRPAIAALHEASLRQFDAWFENFWRFFNRSGLRDNTILIVTADHGDEHLERGLVGHASTTHRAQLHEEITHLPLFIWLPKRLGQAPAVIEGPTDHRDVMPSLLAWLGRSDWPAPLLAPDPERPWIAFSSGAGFAEADPLQVQRYVAARIEGGWKMHQVYEQEKVAESRLYYLPDDPGETRDLSHDRPEIAQRMAAAMLADFNARRKSLRGTEAAQESAAAPRWVRPAASGALRFRDIGEEARLEWSGDKAKRYVLEYEAGEGGLSLKGRLDVDGTAKDFGRIDRDYWERYILPYGRVRLRVGLAGQSDAWSDWLELRALP